MAQQESFIKLKGRIGDLTFYKTRNGYQVREAKGIDAARMATDPKFQRTRENGQEFGHAGRVGKRLRDALRPMTLGVNDARMANRLTAALLRVARADETNRRGERLVAGEHIHLLRNFSFNQAAQLESTLVVTAQHAIDRAGGTVTTLMEAFDARVSVIASPGSTHFRFVLGALAVDFQDPTAPPTLAVAESDYHPVDAVLPATELSAPIAPGTTDTILHLFGIQFLQEVNANQYALQLGTRNALAIVETDHS